MTREPDARTRSAQHRASDPSHSAWVSANAGSGKTHVLAARVARLLLDGVAPARILCLTFTKAAAANMSARVFQWLGEWAVVDDTTLRKKLADIGASPVVSLDIARKLFARAVETPGGLKIQTIHAFCERVLHLFPFEANVAADFRVLEETEQSELMATALASALAALRKGDAHGQAALALVAENTWDDGFVGLVGEMLRHRDVRTGSTPEERVARLRTVLQLGDTDTEAALRHAILHDGLQRSEWRSAAASLAKGSSTDQDRADKLLAADALPDEAAVIAYLDLFRTSTGGWQQSMATQKVRNAAPDLAARLNGEMQRLAPLREKWLATRIVSRTTALDIVAGAVITQYEDAKRLRALLDFDDLIAATRALLTRAHVSNWVLFKLDGGIDHILVDEAQDTSAPQWSILEALSREFTSGEGRPRARRTFFAVGDEKQSIFSFQGAAPLRFDEMRRDFQKRSHEAGLTFAPVQLQLSFRSALPVLNAVDTVFTDPARRRGLSSDSAGPAHTALKADLPGLVEIWPPLAAKETAPPESWILPLDASGDYEPPARLAHKIAAKIATLVVPDTLEAVEGPAPGSRRAIRPGDIMVLVRRRDAFFEAVIRSLKDLGVRVAGADRLDVVGHIAVMDLAAAARVALLPEDDLSLASVLKSPLIGLDDDDLISLAPKRKGTLLDALSRSDAPRHRDAAARIARWRQMGAHLSPFDFFAQILGRESGRRAFLARLGAEANDALDEFLALALAHERTAAPSLTSFLAALDTLTLDVKRDLEAADDAVRVMTVHAAKGLEAKIVFLPDTCATPPPQLDPKLYVLEAPAGPVLAWSAGRKNDPAPLGEARDTFRAAQEDEYRRLLYVAMTRAEERLYICGYYNVRKPPVDCWHTMVWQALEPISESVPDGREEFGEILHFGQGQMLDSPAVTTPGAAEEPLPEWLTTAARTELATLPPLRPSNALASADAATGGRDDVPSPARLRGVALHTLLQRLPEVAPTDRVARGREILSTVAPGADHDALIAEALRVIDTPALAPLFAPNSLAEVPIAATLARSHGSPVAIAGQIDRLAEHEGVIFIADYKTGANEIDPAHVAQVALYVAALRQIDPEKPVRATLVYTAGPRIVELDERTIDDALARTLAET